MTLEQFLLGTSFHLAASERKEAGGPGMAVWGRFATTSFEGEAGGIDMDGTVTTGFLGADAEWERLLAGVMVSHSLGEGSYGGSAGNGEVESTLSGVYPYAKLDLSRRMSVWGLAGAGLGRPYPRARQAARHEDGREPAHGRARRRRTSCSTARTASRST